MVLSLPIDISSLICKAKKIYLPDQSNNRDPLPIAILRRGRLEESDSPAVPFPMQYLG